MPREFGRNRRIADQVQREVAAMVQSDLDPRRYGLVTVSGADVSPDLKQARIYFTCIGGGLAPAELAQHLNQRAPQFRHRLAGMLATRSVPKLTFSFDESVERGSRINALLRDVGRDDD